MKRSKKRIQRFLPFVISSLFLLLQPALHEYQDMAETELIFPVPVLENADPECLISEGRQGRCQGLMNVPILRSFLITNPYHQLPNQTFPLFIPNQETTTLRC